MLQANKLIFSTKSVRHIFHEKYPLRTWTLPATPKYVVLLSPTFHGLKSYFRDTQNFVSKRDLQVLHYNFAVVAFT